MAEDVEKKELTAHRDEKGRWLPGHTPPGAGRPLLARQRLGDKFIKVLATISRNMTKRRS
jgi:hypothetical protein